MPATGRDRNDSSSEEESEDEVIIQPRRRASGFRVLGGPPAAASPAAAATPQEAKSAVLGQIQNMANQQQANEVVVAAPVVAEKTAEEKRALEERQRMLQQQQIAKAQQAAAIQAAAARVAQAHSQNIGTNQAEVEAKEQAARAQAEAERRGAEARQAQAKALQAAQEQTKRAQEEAARKAQEAKVRVEEQARAVKQQQENFLAAQKAQVEAQARAQAEANARADAARKAQQEAQARAQLETQAKIEAAKKAQAELQAKAQAEAQARTQALKAQQDAQIRANAQAQVEARAKAEAQAKAQAQARAQAEAQARTKAQAEAQARAKAQAEAQSKAQLQAKGTQARPNQQQQQQVVPDVKSAVSNKNTRVVPAIPQKSQAQQNIASSHSKPGSSSTGMLDLKKESLGSSPSSELQTTGATLIHHAPRPTGQKPTWNPPVRSVPQKDLGPLDTNGQLKQTAKAQEDQLSISEIRAAPPTLGISSAQLPSIRQENVVEKFVEKQDEQSLKEPTQRAGVQMLAGADRWERDSAIREQQATTMGGENTEKPAAVRLQDDACWMTQHRQPVEIQPPQVGKVTIPELSDGHVVQKTVIVTKPQSYQKVKWNEFPEEVKPEIGQAPKVQTQDWTPVNQEAQEMQRSLYKPARISRVWPPPEETLEKETAPMSAVKASDDCGWIQQEQNEVLRSAAWSSAAKINRVWPPPEEDGNDRDYSGPQHMPAVQWPPSESEQHEREQVEVLQKHLPTKKIERQWPPPPPQYQEVQMNEVITNQESHATQATAQAVNSMDFGHLLA